MNRAAPTGPEWLAYLAAELGTDKWVCAARLTPYLRSKGYTLAISPGRWIHLQDAYNALQATAKAERIARSLDVHPDLVRAALTAEGLL